MQNNKVTIANEKGLHARAATEFVKLSNAFQADVRLISKQSEADGKSILQLLILGAVKGTELTLQTEGIDEIKAFQQLSSLINNNFGEDS